MIPQQRDPDGPKGTEHELTAPDQSPPDLGGGGGGLSPFMILLGEFRELKGLVSGALLDHTRKLDDLSRTQDEHTAKIQDNSTQIALVKQTVDGMGNQGPRRWQAVGAWAGAVSAVVALIALIVALLR